METSEQQRVRKSPRTHEFPPDCITNESSKAKDSNIAISKVHCALHKFHSEAFCTPFLSCESLKHKQNSRVTLVASLHEQRFTSWGNRVLTTSYYYEKSSYLSVRVSTSTRVHVSSLRIIRFGPAAVAFYPFDLSNVDLLSVSNNTNLRVRVLVYHTTGIERIPSNVCEMPSSPHGLRTCLLPKPLLLLTATSAIYCAILNRWVPQALKTYDVFFLYTV